MGSIVSLNHVFGVLDVNTHICASQKQDYPLGSLANCLLLLKGDERICCDCSLVIVWRGGGNYVMKHVEKFNFAQILVWKCIRIFVHTAARFPLSLCPRLANEKNTHHILTRFNLKYVYGKMTLGLECMQVR